MLKSVVPSPLMGSAYLFSLVVGFGILMIQTVLGSKDADAEGELGADKEFDFDGDGHADHEIGVDGELDHQLDLDTELDGELDAGEGELEALHDGIHTEHAPGADKDVAFASGFVALFLSTRFWIFASLGFGLTGTLLHFLTGVAAGATLASAITMGVLLGLSASLAFRALRKTASPSVANTTGAVGRVAKVIVPCGGGSMGKVRIELRGQSVDLLAKSGSARIATGDKVVIEEFEGEVATVSRAPKELQ